MGDELKARLRALKWEGWVAFSGGAFAILMGLTVLFGWYIHSIVLIQLSPHFVAMQFNTALVILLSGLALASLSLNWSFPSQSFALIGGGIALLTLLQYLFKIDLGIDQVFHTYNLAVPMDHPGRMAFNTSSALLSTNLAIISLNHRRNFYLSLLSSVMSILVVSVAVTSFIGHLTGLEAIYGYLDFARMAVHTAIACFVLGICTFTFAVRSSWDQRVNNLALPTTIIIGMLAATLAVWQVFRAQEHIAIQLVINNQAKNLQKTFNEELQNELKALKRMVDRWESIGNYPLPIWTVDSHNYVHDLVGLEELAIYNQDLKFENRTIRETAHPIDDVQKIFPDQIDSIKKGNLATQPSPHNDSLYIYYPIMVQHEFKGALVASIDLVEILMAEVKADQLGNYLVSLSFNHRVLFSGGDLRSPISGITVENPIASEYGPWTVSLTPTQSSSVNSKSSIDLIILITGVIVTALSGGLVFVGQNIRLQKKELEKVNYLLTQASEKADAANVAKGVFLATMSHEIRTPLNAIVGTIELLAETELNPVQKKYLDRVVQSSKVLLELIGDILDFSKIEAGGVMLELISADLLTTVKAVTDNLALKAKEKKIDIFVEYPSQPLPQLLFDPIRIQQILSNLGNNSYKFTDTGYLLFRILVKTPLPEHLLIRFEVIDTGIGISSEDQKKLFQKFSQVERTQSRKYGGVGLGLSICKKLIDLMKGEIGVISEAGKGSTFWVEIPFEISSKTPPPLYSIGNKSVLLLDEKEKEKEILKKYLEDWGAKVIHDPNTERPDWILSTSTPPGSEAQTILIADTGTETQGRGAVVNRPIFPNELYKYLQGKQ